ncbi:MAG: TIGR03808 family TAT-translocated repetitive protein [Rhizobiales bacterium]|nr:TIGR03808 family TAT-translocated repetitive protein [Hyphomicrobiales bacterium]
MDRRLFLTAALGATALGAKPAAAAYSEALDLRGSIDPSAPALVPGSDADQGAVLQALLTEAAARDEPLVLAPGRYLVSNVTLPARTRLSGIPGATRLIFAGGDSPMLTAEGAELVHLDGLVIDGGGQPFPDYVSGLLNLVGCGDIQVARCTVTGSSKDGISAERCGGRIMLSSVTHARNAGIRAVGSTGLSIADNVVSDCGNAGIQVWRWEAGDDGTIISGNRVERIGALDGGTGQNGNGINIFRAGGVIVSGNRIADCAFTAVRANSASNVQISGNNCRRLGEVGIYSEFGFEGAIIANNVIDTAATGISVANFREGGRLAVVSGNIVRNITATGPYQADAPGFGVGISLEADVAAAGNLIDGAPLFGMQLGWGPYLRDISASGNVIRNAPVGIAVSVVEGSGSAVISDNLISGAGQGAVVAMRWAVPASGDLARSGADDFPNLMVERNRVS